MVIFFIFSFMVFISPFVFFCSLPSSCRPALPLLSLGVYLPFYNCPASKTVDSFVFDSPLFGSLDPLAASSRLLRPLPLVQIARSQRNYPEARRPIVEGDEDEDAEEDEGDDAEEDEEGKEANEEDETHQVTDHLLGGRKQSKDDSSPSGSLSSSSPSAWDLGGELPPRWLGALQWVRRELRDGQQLSPVVDRLIDIAAMPASQVVDDVLLKLTAPGVLDLSASEVRLMLARNRTGAFLHHPECVGATAAALLSSFSSLTPGLVSNLFVCHPSLPLLGGAAATSRIHALMEALGVSQKDLGTTLRKAPSLAAVGKPMSKRSAILKAGVFNELELKEILAKWPQLLTLNLHRNIIPKLLYLVNYMNVPKTQAVLFPAFFSYR
eukprot:GHVT01048315.1.p1 GENE.GHVT01048315.1~~GHVT01048315.1.p1  ORF type:complete len:381 (-),score=69.88 GHVT01048315.1:1175-2317(-)